MAETSLTIPGIRYVVDTGVARIPKYIPGLRTTSLPILPISKSSADQRKGRCGRVANGICVRLYSEEDFEGRDRFTPPEILRANLADVLLKMTALKLGDIRDFPFVDPPADRLVKDGYDVLLELSAIRKKKTKEGASFWELTETGRQMAGIPLDARIARMLLAARDLDCVEEVALIASGITAVDPRERPEDKKQQATQAQKPFVDNQSDFLTLLSIWREFSKETGGTFSTGKLKKFAQKYFLSFKRLKEWRDLHFQIRDILEENGIALAPSRLPDSPEDKTATFGPKYAAIHKAILSGFLSNLARKKEKNLFAATRNREAMIFPGSGLFGKAPDWVVAAEMVETSRLFARCVAALEPEWIVEVAGNLVVETEYDPHWEKKMGAVVAYSRKTLYGMILTDKERVLYGKTDPEGATRIFIRALVDGDIKDRFGFLSHNQKVVATLQATEDRLRRRDLFAGDEAVESFYASRLENLFDVRSLKHLVKKKGGDGFLKLSEEDIRIREADRKALRNFPEKLDMAGDRFTLAYAFKPGEEEDGVTVKVPAARARDIDTRKLEWLVPGLLPQKIEAILRGLPKATRKRLVPITDTARDIARELEMDDRPLATNLSRHLYRRYGVEVPASALDATEVPEHLKMRIAVTDDKGREIASSRMADVLRNVKIDAPTPSGKFEELRKAFTEKVTDAIGCLPESLPLNPENPEAGSAFPGLEKTEAGFKKTLFASRNEALRHHIPAIAALLSKELSVERKRLKRLCEIPARLEKAALYLGGRPQLEDYLAQAVEKPLFEQDIRSDAALASAITVASREMAPRARDLVSSMVPVIEGYAKARTALDALSAKGGPTTRAFVADIQRQLSRLVPENAPLLYPAGKLARLPKYMEALVARARRAVDDFAKDARRAQDVAVHDAALKGLIADLHPGVSEEKKEAIEAFFWLLEEFKVQVFAQELGTHEPVSGQTAQGPPQGHPPDGLNRLPPFFHGSSSPGCPLHPGVSFSTLEKSPPFFAPSCRFPGAHPKKEPVPCADSPGFCFFSVFPPASASA